MTEKPRKLAQGVSHLRSPGLPPLSQRCHGAPLWSDLGIAPSLGGGCGWGGGWFSEACDRNPDSQLPMNPHLPCLWVRRNSPCLQRTYDLELHCPWTFLVAQWLRIYLPMQGTWVRSLVREDPTCRGATKRGCHSLGVWALEPENH